MEGKKQYNSADPSCQVMMLESYLLHLLCVHVLKEASTRGTEKVCNYLPMIDVGLLLKHAREMQCVVDLFLVVFLPDNSAICSLGDFQPTYFKIFSGTIWFSVHKCGMLT